MSDKVAEIKIYINVFYRYFLIIRTITAHFFYKYNQ